MLGAQFTGTVLALGALDVGTIAVRLNYEFAVFDAYIFRTIGVQLRLLIAPTEGILGDAPFAVVQF